MRHLVAENGGRAASYREEDGARIMKSAEITIRVDLARGAAEAAVDRIGLGLHRGPAGRPAPR